MTKPFVNDEVQIEATAHRVWQILTDSAFIQQYMFGCIAETDWKPGSPLLWRGAKDGRLYVKGHIVSIDPQKRLEYTVIGADMDLPDVLENYLTIIYEIEARQNGTVALRASMGDFTTVGDGNKRYDETIAAGGWTPMLTKVKQLAEMRAVSQECA